MSPPASRPAVRVLLALALLLLPSSVWAAAHPAGADGQTERVAARMLPSGEQVVQADRQQVARPGVSHRGDLGRYRSVLLAVLVGIGLFGMAWRRRNPAGTPGRARLRAATLVRAVRAPPRLRSA
jgi:hypothetical protein